MFVRKNYATVDKLSSKLITNKIRIIILMLLVEKVEVLFSPPKHEVVKLVPFEQDFRT